MLIKDYFPDSKRYFDNDCYCLNEVYDLNGLYYKLYYPNYQFSYVMRIDSMLDDTDTFVGIRRNEFLVVFALRDDNEFDKPEGTIADMQRVPINKNNLLAFQDIIKNLPDDDRHDFDIDNDSMESLKKLLSMSNRLVISD